MNNDLSHLLKRRKQLDAMIFRLEQRIKAAKKLIEIDCVFCKTLHKIGELTYIQTHWYTPPRGCTEGDYWNEGEGEFKCPACGQLNRMTYRKPEFEKLKYSFKDIEKTYDRR